MAAKRGAPTKHGLKGPDKEGRAKRQKGDMEMGEAGSVEVHPSTLTKAPPTTDTKRARIWTQAPSDLASRTLTSINLVNINRIDNLANGLAINRRTTDLINLVGFKIDMAFRNLRPGRVLLNIAVLVPRTATVITTSTLPVPDFFQSNNLNRGEDWNPITKFGFENHIMPINTDQYEVVMHKRITLGEAGTAAANRSLGYDKPPYFFFSKWVPFQREMRYRTNLGTSANNSPCLVYWVNEDEAPAGLALIPATTKLYGKITTHWREAQ